MKKLVPSKARNGLSSILHLRSSFADSIWDWNELLFGFSFEPYSCDFVDVQFFTASDPRSHTKWDQPNPKMTLVSPLCAFSPIHLRYRRLNTQDSGGTINGHRAACR